MCGFVGIIAGNATQLQEKSRDEFGAKALAIAHRGDTETRSVFEATYWITHHRLAFQDLSSGRQPMFDRSREWLIVFNGEIYNHLDLRLSWPKLRGFPFQTRSDTETLIEGYLAHGEEFFGSLDGEYAFLILKKDGSQIVAHRDPSGVKPLFMRLQGVSTERFAIALTEGYTEVTSEITFASEIKGLMGPKIWDRDGLLRQFTGLYEPIRTPFAEVIQLLPGSVFTATRQGDTNSVFSCNWKPRFEPVRDFDGFPTQTEAFAPFDTSGFLTALEKSVEERLLSDVELGVYLSGGVDSRTIAALLGKIQGRKKSTRYNRHAFTVGFAQAGYDESAAALEFAQASGFTSHLLQVDDASLAYAYPFAVETSENVQPYTNGAAKWWLSHLTRQHVQGVLTGDGADELLCGYPSFRYVKWWSHIMRARENNLSRLKSQPLGQLPRDMLYASVFSGFGKDPWLAGSSSQGTGLDFVDSLAIWGVAHPLFGQVQAIASVLLGKETQGWLEAQGPSLRSWFGAGMPEGASGLDRPQHALLFWQNYFFKTHLPVQVLNWVGDRMEMAHVLEGRTPFLSKRMRDFVSKLPDRALVSGFSDKFILRRAMLKLMPEKFSQQPKKQFGAPFLDLNKLLTEFPPGAAFEAVGLNTQKIFERLNKREGDLQKSLMSVSTLANGSPAASQDATIAADLRYELSHLNQVRQTAVTLGIVDKTLVRGQKLQRNEKYEQGVLSKERIH